MRKVKRLLPYVVVTAIIVFLLRQMDPVDVLRLLARADWRWLLLGLVAYVVTNIVRAYRYGVLLQPTANGKWDGGETPDIPDKDERNKIARAIAPLSILPEMFAVSFFNNTLPSRAGEVSFPYYMWRRHGTAVGESSAALIIARVFDYVAVAALYIGCAWANLYRLSTNAATAVRVVAMFLLISFLGLAAIPWIGQRALTALAWLLERLGLRSRRAAATLLRIGQQVVDRFHKMRTLRIYALTLFWSLLGWVGTFLWFAAFMQAIGLGRPLGIVVVGATFSMLAKAVPFITVGGFGAHEAGWTLGFSLVGMPVDLAIASGFAVNILTLLASTIFGGGAVLLMQTQDRAAARAAARTSHPT